MLNDLELLFLDNFDKSMWGGDQNSYWLKIECEDVFFQTFEILKNEIGFTILLDQYAYEVEEQINISCVLFHPIANRLLHVKYFASNKFTLSSISQFWPVCDWKEDEICEFYGIKMLRKIEKRLLTPSSFSGFPALSSSLHATINENDSIFRSMTKSSSRLLPLLGDEEKLDFKMIEDCNFPTGTFAVNKGQVLESKITLGKFHKGIELNLVGKNFTEIESYLEEIDYYCFFENKFSFYLLVEKVNAEIVSDDITAGRSILLEFERIYRNLTIIKNLISILNLKLGFDELFIDFYSLYESLKEKSEFSSFSVGTIVQKGYEKLLKIINHSDFKSSMKSFRNISKIDCDLVLDLGITGPTLRSAGFLLDWRNVNHYLNYDQLVINNSIQSTGDLSQRYQQRIDDIFSSMKLILDLTEHLNVNIPILKNNINNTSFKKNGHFFQAIEGNNGVLLHSVIIDNLAISRYRISSADYSLIKLYEKISINEKKSYSELIWNSLGINLGQAER